MKKIIIATLTAAAMGLSAYGQGSIFFQNFASSGITAQGGGFPGSQFQVSLYYVSGTFSGTPEALIATGTYFAANAPMFGDPSPLINPTQVTGAGYFDAGIITIPSAPAGTYSMVAVAYFGGPSYSAALLNPLGWVGYSPVFTAELRVAPNPTLTAPVPSFMVVPVPEPSSFALAGLGLAGLLIFRRRK